MSDLLAALIQMATSLAFHIIFAVVGIALPLMMVVAEALWLRTGALPVLVGLSAVGMALVCLAFYRFVERQLDLAEVIGLREVVAIATAAAGTVLLVALR